MNTIAMWIGYALLVVVAILILKPLLRGLSYGLWETVVFYKCGVSFWRVFKRFVTAVFINFPFWGLVNTGTSSITNNMAGWYGIFGWCFEKSFTRAISKRETREREERKEKALDAMDDDTWRNAPAESEEEPFELDDDK